MVFEITPAFIYISIIAGVILGIITMSMGNPALKIIIDIVGLVAVLGGLLLFIPNVNIHMTLQQSVDAISNLFIYFINVVIPYVIADLLSSIGYSLIVGNRRQQRGF
jgi:hypothetical protein